MLKMTKKVAIFFATALFLYSITCMPAAAGNGPALHIIYDHYFALSMMAVFLMVFAATAYYYHVKMIALKIRYEKTVDSLKEQQEIFDLLMEFSPIYVFFKDDKVRTLKLSRNYEKMLGMPISNAIGKTMDDLFPSDFAKKMIQDDLKILNDEVPAELVEELGGRTYVTLKFPIKRPDKPKFMAGFTIDITKQKRVEKALTIAKQQAEAANEAKSMFLANMSHELRTPMNGIIGFTGLMAMSGLNEKQKEYNEMIKTSASHLLELINDILDFSKLEARKLKLESGPFSIVQAAKNSVDLIEQHAKKKNLKLELEFKSDINYKIKGDQLRVKQIMINLLSNAVKFTNSGSINLAIDEKERQDLKTVIVISVSDTGIGIAADKLEKIFEMFIQLDNSASKTHGGAGLGLSIVKGLAETMGGKISLVSEEGKGSVFTVEIPFDIYFVSEEQSAPDVSNQCAVSPIDNFKRPLEILIAEDDTINQKLMSAIMFNLNWKTSIASNGREAVELFMKNKYDAIIMDGQMPEMNGFEAARRIREIEKSSGGHVPIIALTAYAMKGDREKFIASGMDDYMSKPISGEKVLVDILRKYIND
ncbi:MAG TPA: ATP-binding protein [Candidatus Wallbacteria bacterium]|nr:ATP-binding protein [Candidatus Wallbacteria bacterium]